MTEQYYVHTNKKSAPLVFVIGAILFMFGEVIDYQAGMPSYILQALGMVLAYWGMFWLWQNENISGMPAIGFREIIWVLMTAVSTGFLAELVALWNKPFVMVLAQSFGMLTAVHLFVALGYLLLMGKARHWWYDDRGYMTWAPVLLTIVLWLVLAGVGSLLASSHVPYFQSAGKLISIIRWWSLLTIPLVLIARWANRRKKWREYTFQK